MQPNERKVLLYIRTLIAGVEETDFFSVDHVCGVFTCIYSRFL